MPIKVAHNLHSPYSMTNFKVIELSPETLAKLLGNLAAKHGLYGQAPNEDVTIMGYIFNNGIAVNVQH